MALFQQILRQSCVALRKCSLRCYVTNDMTQIIESASVDLNSLESVSTPILTRELQFPPKYQRPREVWIENLDKVEEEKRGLVKLHPHVFGTMPRVDLIYRNMLWQDRYRTLKTLQINNRAECRGGGRKPWPQKGLGKARQGSIRAPQFKGGGAAHGPRNPTYYFYMLPYHMRLAGLTSMLSVKLAQDDLHVVDNLDIPTEDSKFVLDLIRERHWGLSVLIVDDTDIMPRNITMATDSIGHVNLMPAYGLNVWSMLKHETLVLTYAAVNSIEASLLTHLNNNNDVLAAKKFRLDQ